LKNARTLIIGMIAGAVLATAGSAYAASAIEKVTAMIRPDYKVVVDGKQVQLKNPPISYNSTTYIPLREAGEILGRTVGFQDGTITIDQQPAETGGKDDAGVSATTQTAEWIAIDQLDTYGITVNIDEDNLKISHGSKTLTFKNPTEDSVQAIPGGYSIKKESSGVYLSGYSLKWLLDQ